jgi:hypothetical protein
MNRIKKYFYLKQTIKNLPIPKMIELPAWMEKRIDEDIASASIFGSNLADRNSFVFCKIRNSKFSFKYSTQQLLHYRLHVLINYLKFLSSHYVLPDLEFAIFYGDALETVPSWVSVPTLTFAKRKDSKGPILIPDFQMLEGYEAFNLQLEQYVRKYPWENKKNISFWRGASTGGFLNTTNFLTIPRVQLAFLSLENPHLIDAYLSEIVQSSEEVSTLLKKKGVLAHSVAVADHFAYKYLIDVDGNTCSYSRMYWILYSNCVLFKQVSHNIQWYYYGLEDLKNVCFFSLENDSTVEKITTLITDDELARSIAENGRLFCKKYLNSKFVAQYIMTLLSKLKELS